MNTTEFVRAYLRRTRKVSTLREISDAIGMAADERKFVSSALHRMALNGEVQKWELKSDGRTITGYSRSDKEIARRKAN